VTDRPAIEAHELRAAFGATTVLRALSFEIDRGERVALLGPNGAGKTTLLRVLAGLLRRHGGQLQVLGLDPSGQAGRLRRAIGVLSHQTLLYGELTVQENLLLFARLYDLPDAAERVGQRLEQVGLFGRRGDRVESLSRGLQQRLAIARALLHDPILLLLDEPDTGLDLAAYQMLETLLVGGAVGRTIVMATHSLQQAARVCRRGLVLVGGRLVAADAIEAIDTGRLGALYRRPLAAAPVA
jgi:heme exporter protein A